MRLFIAIASLLFLLLWLVFGAVFVGYIEPSWLPEALSALVAPSSFAQLGNAFNAFSALLSPVALILALASIFVQRKHQADSNVIGAFSARQNFLLQECTRLESEIQALKNSDGYDRELLQNMANKKKRLLDEARVIDQRLQALLSNV